MVAQSIIGIDEPDKPLRWAHERARQDQKNGYRLVAKQRQRRRMKLALSKQHQQQQAEAQVRYEERIAGLWPILKSGQAFD